MAVPMEYFNKISNKPMLSFMLEICKYFYKYIPNLEALKLIFI